MAERFDILGDYQPQKDDNSDFEIIKEKALKCTINNISIETAPEKSMYAGQDQLRYELEVLDPPYVGRKFWKNFNLENEDKVKRMADFIFTVTNKSVKSREDLEQVIIDMLGKQIVIRAWGWTPPDNDDPIQMHAVKGPAEDFEDAESEEDTVTTASF